MKKWNLFKNFFGEDNNLDVGKPYKYEDEFDDEGNPLSEEEFCHKMFENSGKWGSYFSEPITTAKNNKDFIYRSNWDDRAKSDRQVQGKMCAEVNIVAKKQADLITENRSVSPQVELIPMSKNIPSQIIEVKDGLLRHIAYESKTDLVYSQTCQDLYDCGWGAMHLAIVKTKNGMLHEEIRFENVPDLFCCFWDPDARSPFKEDGQYAGYATTMPNIEFKKKFPGIELPPNDGILVEGGSMTVSDDSVGIIVAYKRQYKKIKVLITEDGNQFTESEYAELEEQYAMDVEKQKKMYDAMLGAAVKTGIPENKLPPFKPSAKKVPKIEKTESSYREYICAYLMTRHKVLKKKELGTDELPLYFIPGAGVVKDGMWTPIPFALNAQGPQRAANYAFSEIIDDINQRIRSKIIGTRTHFADNQNQWVYPNRSQALSYAADPLVQNGRPEIMQAPSMDGAILQFYQQARQDVEFMMGINPDLSSDASGNAMIVDSMKNAHGKGAYSSNLALGIAQINKGALKLMPSVYDSERTIIVRSKSGELDYKTINKNTYELDENQQMRIENDMSIGDFTVEAHAGSSFAAQQIMAVNFLNNFTRLETDKLLPFTADYIVENAPFPFSQKLAARMRDNIVPPDVIAKEEGKPAPPQKPNPEMIAAKAEFAVKMKELELKQEQMKADVISAISKAMIEAQQTKAKNIQSAAEVESAAIKAQAEMGRSIEDTFSSIIESENKTIEKVEDTLVKLLKEE